MRTPTRIQALRKHQVLPPCPRLQCWRRVGLFEHCHQRHDSARVATAIAAIAATTAATATTCGHVQRLAGHHRWYR